MEEGFAIGEKELQVTYLRSVNGWVVRSRCGAHSARIDDRDAMTCAETRSGIAQNLRLLNYVNIYSTLVKQRA
jgi:hypothetical protein